MRFASRPENRRRLVWSTTVAVLVSLAAGLGLVLTSGDGFLSPRRRTHRPCRPRPRRRPRAQPRPQRPAPTPPVGRQLDRHVDDHGHDHGLGWVAPKIDAAAAAATTTVPASTLTAGSPTADVTELQRQLNVVTGSSLELDGVYGAGTEAAVRNFQAVIGVPTTGVADPVTRWMLAEAANRVVLPIIGAGGINGCQVAVIGDSLMAGAEPLHVEPLARVGCAAAVDGEGGRSLSYGWQCRVDRDGRWPLLLFEDRIPGNETCAPSGLTLLASWADAACPRRRRRRRTWGRTTPACTTSPGGNKTGPRRCASQGDDPSCSSPLRPGPAAPSTPARTLTPRPCGSGAPGQRLCVLAEWANTAAAADPASYVDTVHLNVAGTRARAAFIAEVVAALLTGRPIPNPQPPPTPAIPPAETTTTVATAPVTRRRRRPPRRGRRHLQPRARRRPRADDDDDARRHNDDDRRPRPRRPRRRQPRPCCRGRPTAR